MATQSDIVVVDLDNGTFIHIEQCVFVDFNKLSRQEVEDFNNGYEERIIDIADEEGTSVMSVLKSSNYFS
jgi:hypothetical protein